MGLDQPVLSGGDWRCAPFVSGGFSETFGRPENNISDFQRVVQTQPEHISSYIYSIGIQKGGSQPGRGHNLGSGGLQEG